jgi:hypothetical protein
VSRNKERNKTEPMRVNTKNKKNPTQQCVYTFTEVVCLVVGIEFATVCSKPHGTYSDSNILAKRKFFTCWRNLFDVQRQWEEETI